MKPRIVLMLVAAIVAVPFTNLAHAANPTYSTVAASYSRKPPAGFRAAMKRHYGETNPNSCAIRLAFALEAANRHFFDAFRSPATFQNKPIRARELADYLADRVAGAMSIPTGRDGRKAIQNRKGIVYFEKIRPRAGQSGVSWHISLWDGNSVVDKGDYLDRANRVHFWPLGD